MHSDPETWREWHDRKCVGCLPSDSPHQPGFIFSFYMSCFKTYRSVPWEALPPTDLSAAVWDNHQHTHTVWGRAADENEEQKSVIAAPVWSFEGNKEVRVKKRRHKVKNPLLQNKLKLRVSSTRRRRIDFSAAPGPRSLDLVFSFRQFVALALIFLPHLFFIALAFVFSTCPLSLPLFVLLTLLLFHSLLSSLSFMRAVLKITLPTVSGRYTNCNLNK